MTQRLYYTDCYTTEFTARVVATRAKDQQHHEIELDRTFFYPTSGGQLHDLGELAGGAVIDVVEEGERVLHVVAVGSPPSVGGEIKGRVDAVRRRHHRQQHTGQHVLSRVLELTLGLSTVSSRLGETGNTIDLPTGTLDAGVLDRVEDEANRWIWEGRPVSIHFLSSEEAATEELRKRPSRQGTIRVIEVEGLDRSPCGGTHVSNTAEIGIIAIGGAERVKGNLSRIHFLCGDSALAWRRSCERRLTALAADLTTGSEMVGAAVERLREQAREQSRRAQSLAKELAGLRARNWLARAEVVPSRGGELCWVGQQLDEALAPMAGELAGQLVAQERAVAALAWSEGGRTHLLLARHAEVDLDCRRLLQQALAASAGKGGGTAERARGATAGALPEDLLAQVRSALADGR